ncbi:MAG: hypothetical protein OXP66_10705 [Candidatus Tectomicrobia bacterium]|nr:hypothetical protein [Candidatus Tectomicrobia bacterium]
MDTVKYDFKLFLQDTSRPAPEDFIPVFHDWIQNQALDELLIDVVDYRHVPDGPGVILIAHDAHYAIDMADERPGLLYSRRRETHPTRNAIRSATERLHSVLQCALRAALALEAEPSLAGRVKFRGDELLLRINDRLVSPTLEAFDDLQAHLQPVLATLYPHDHVQVERHGGPDSRLSMTIRASETSDVATLHGRLGELSPV